MMATSKSGSNSSKSESHSSSNSGDGKIEKMDCLPENNNTMVYRVWIVKKSISFGEIGRLFGSCATPRSSNEVLKEKILAFDATNETKIRFKHWAIILELSNGTYVNIQFGESGFSLKEFNKTNISGENILDSIVCTWGYSGHPFSFCYLGNANFDYEKLKEKLRAIKNEEVKSYEKNHAVYYHLIHRNCQHFACDIEKILFGNIQFWHSFKYYIEDFYHTFFKQIDINQLKQKLREQQ